VLLAKKPALNSLQRTIAFLMLSWPAWVEAATPLVPLAPSHTACALDFEHGLAGMFHPFIQDKDVRIIGVQAAGEGIHTDKHCATLVKGTPGVLHGALHHY